MNSDQLEAQIHNLLSAIAAILVGYGVTNTSTASDAVGIILGVLTVVLSHRANTPAAVATSATANAQAAMAAAQAITPPKP